MLADKLEKMRHYCAANRQSAIRAGNHRVLYYPALFQNVLISPGFSSRPTMNSFSVRPVLIWLNRCAFALSTALLASCASTVPNEQSDTSEQVFLASRTYHEAIDMSGRLSIRYQANGSEQALHGSFNWSQRPGRILVSLLSPLGQTMATIESTPSETILRQPGQAPRAASDVDTLTAETLGWPLPVSGLRHWLQGFTVDAGGRRAIAAPAQNVMPQATAQDGWRLNYASWNTDAALPHPKRLDLQRTTPQAGDVDIRLIIDTFQPL
jgi:outer membrane lipoprotein LolB